MEEITVGTDSVTTSDGLEVTNSSSTPEQMKANLDAENDGKEAETDPVKKAASELGKRGGEAAAKAREVRERDAKKAAKEADLDEPAKEPEKEPAVEPEGKKGNPRHDPRARIEQLARERRAAEDRAKAAEERIARLEAAQKPKETPAGPADDYPTPDRVETYEEYVKSVAKIEGKRAAEERYQELLKESREREQTETAAGRALSRVEALNKRISEGAQVVRDEETGEIDTIEVGGKRVDPRFLALTPTFMLSPDQAPGPLNDIAQMLMDSDQMLPLMAYLTEHEDEMEALTKAGHGKSRDEGIQAIGRYIGRLEKTLEMGSAEPPPPVTAREAPKPAVSQAKPPLAPLAGSAVAGEEDIDSIEDFDTYAARANARDARLRRAGR